jgi:putative ABC transport system permease protein
VLRVLGLRGRELRSTVRWQALTTTAVGLVVGLPLGIVLGRLAWRRFADQLGLVPRADIPWTWLVGIVVAAVALGLLAAFLPGRYAARVRPAAILRRQ